MSEVKPEMLQPKKKSQFQNWALGGLGFVMAVGLFYGIFKAMPNGVGGKDLRAFAEGDLAKMEILPEPPPQPVQAIRNADGKEVRLSDFRGKVVLVNLWATWCAPCVAEMPTLARLQEHFKGKEFVVVAVSVDRAPDKAEAMAELAKLSKQELAFFHDPSMSIVFPLKARGFPTSILYDRDGNELARLAGEADWSKKEAIALIEATVSRK